MTDHMEVEPHHLQEDIEEAHERGAEERGNAWVRYVGLTAAIFAVIAAVAALRSGALINEAMIAQLKASDTWAEYQASREKQYIYAVALDALIDRGSRNAGRMRAYHNQVAREIGKQRPLVARARGLEEESAGQVERHHAFEYAVALLQVGIALGAVAALARFKPAWYVSIAAGLCGVAVFVWGFR